MQTLRLFDNVEEARTYRHQHGTGGWIFANSEVVILFPPELPPSGVFGHPLTRGMSGKLIGN